MKPNCWVNAKHTHKKEFYLDNEDHMYDDALYDEMISRALRMRDFNFMKVFLIRLVMNNIYLNVK